METEDGFVRRGACRIDHTARICAGAVIGKRFRPLLEGDSDGHAAEPTVIGPNTYIGHYAVVGSGSVLSSDVIVDDYCSIESDVTLGERCLVIYRAQICNEANVRNGCVIGGFIAERVVVGDRVRIFGKVVHSQHDPTLGWDAPEVTEASAVIGNDAFVGFDAMIIGGVSVGERAYVCAGAIVTKDVPARHVACGVNRMIPFDQWPGPLARSPFFQR